ncbi:DgyrCDS3205 [Dimorphilus gyrociliatus]|uniref:DgyrCDS3205 n=1 Tax=Dimorphilus gyrociliatus TaxID=2664684 RepID=A0A7I8VHL1_9ANNE|nr:DgyrCDS3205 [Dimorphilus gyrociliatus]
MQSAISLIKQYSPLAEINEDKKDKFSEHLETLEDQCKGVVAEIIGFIHILHKEICYEKGYTYETPASEVSRTCVQFLNTIMERDLSYEEAKPVSEKLMNQFTNIFEIQATCSGNLDAIEEFFSNSLFMDYIEKDVSEVHISKWLKSLCKEFQPKKNDKNSQYWAENITNTFSSIYSNVSSKTLLKCKDEVVEGLLFWAKIGMKYKEDDTSKVIFVELVNSMISIFEQIANSYMLTDVNQSEIFKNWSDEKLENFLSRCQSMLLQDNFPPNPHPKDAMRLLISDCLESYTKETENGVHLALIHSFHNKINCTGNSEAQSIVDDLKCPLEEKMNLINFEAAGKKSIVQQFFEDIDNVKNTKQADKVCSYYEKTFNSEILPALKGDIEIMKQFIKVIVNNPYRYISDKFFSKPAKTQKLLNIKANPTLLKFIFDTMYEAKVDYNEESKSAFNDIGYATKNQLDKENLFSKFKNDIYDYVERSFNFVKHPYHNAVEAFNATVDWKGQIERFNRIVIKVKAILEKDHSHYRQADPIVTVFQFTSEYIMNSARKNKKFIEYAKNFGDLFNYCYTLPWLADEDLEEKWGLFQIDSRRTLAGRILYLLMRDVYKENNDYDDFIRPIVGTLKKLKKQDDDAELQEMAIELLSLLTDQIELLGNDAGTEIINEFLDAQDPFKLDKIVPLYSSNSDIIHERLDDIIEIAEQNESFGTAHMTQLIDKIAEANPKQITKRCFQYLIDVLHTDFCSSAISPLQKLTNKRFELFKDTQKIFKDHVENHKYGGFFLSLLPDLSRTQELANYYAKIIWNYIQKGKSDHEIAALYALRSLALRFKEPVAAYRKELDIMKNDVKLKDYVMYIIDVLEGRSLETVANDVQEQREDIDNLDSRVTENEEKIVVLDTDVKETKKDVADVKQDVKETKKRIDQIEYTMKGLDERVEQLNHMTLSHAPAWSRHVSELMNDQSDNDWRLLSMKLNYSNDDIRNWATQPDPCLSMLDEWFATHKTREATFAILNNLKEMNRLDAAEIVENALASVKNVVKDDEDEEFEKPEIFLSYQWGHQQEVKMLKKHLEMAGFKAWMDIGQMGGGDKLYAKIDDGVRSAKVIISCVSEKYAKSANCCREVNLSTNLGKPMIPLLMEKLQWPPAGPMGPIMSEYLYVQFFKNGGMQKGDTVFWMPPKFQELLMQIRYYVVPDMKLITKDSPYAGWMNPPEEEIIIPKREQKAVESKTSNAKSEEEEVISPDVFISYQWDKQPQIKRLYKKLSGLGYHCWLDIMQMGGGDSLFDKIDKGIRGCRVVISCVTPKYALSANCRREVSLSGALNKPIIPLLLDNMKWPPEGPMSMVFTQLLYIGFHRKKDDKLWEGDEFNQLISKIDMNAPGCKIEQQSSSSKEATNNTKEKKDAKNEIEKKNAQTQKTEKRDEVPKKEEAKIASERKDNKETNSKQVEKEKSVERKVRKEDMKKEKNVGNGTKQPEQSPEKPKPTSDKTNSTPPAKKSSTCSIL